MLVYGRYLGMVDHCWQPGPGGQLAVNCVLQYLEEAFSFGYCFPRTISGNPVQGLSIYRPGDSVHAVVCACFTSHELLIVRNSVQRSLKNVHVDSLVGNHIIIPSRSPNTIGVRSSISGFPAVCIISPGDSNGATE